MNDIEQHFEATGLSLDELRSRASLTVEEAAATLGIGRSSAYAAVRSGELPHVRLGKRVIIPASAILRMLDADQPAASA